MALFGDSLGATNERIAQELVRRIGVEAWVPDETQGVRAQLEGYLHHRKTEPRRELLGDSLRDRQRVVGLRGEAQRGHEVGDGPGDAAGEPTLLQHIVDVSSGLTTGCHLNVWD